MIMMKKQEKNYMYLSTIINFVFHDVSWPGRDEEETSKEGPTHGEASDDHEDNEGDDKIGEQEGVQRAMSLNVRDGWEQNDEE